MARKDIEKFKWQKGQSGNPNGRPKNFVSKVLEAMKKEGTVLSKKHITDIYLVMVTLTQDQLQQIGLDKDMPMVYRIVAKGILSKKGFEIIETMFDRALGKPIQEQKHSGQVETNIDIVLPKPNEEVMKQFLKAKNYTKEDETNT